jgi:hypothetical protein
MARLTNAARDVPTTEDRRFFRTLISVMATILLAGFVAQLALGRSSFSAPFIVHAHAIVFMGWVGIAVAQAWLVAGGNLALHRRLGMVAVAWSIGLLILGPLVTIATIQSARTPFFFQPQHFLIANPMSLIGFAALFSAAIIMRRQFDWHSRLHIGAFVMLMGPGFGRLLPMPFLPPYAFETAGLVALIFPVVGILRDWRVHGRPHPAWFWGIGVLLATTLLARVIGFSPVGEAIYTAVTAGSSMAGTDGLAFPAPPPGAI